MTDVRQRRFQLGVLQVELAKRSGIACARLSQIESGQVEAQPEELQRIRTALEERRAPFASLSLRGRTRQLVIE